MKPIKIESGVEVPEYRRGRRAKYPFKELEVGQSFVYPHEKVRLAAASHAKRYGVKFTVRKTEDGKYRCWRTE
ncbi:MAG: hypothetical protein QQN63_04115 [Nitrosopumilus sp.]